jgi:hypothetical protein
MDGWKVYSSSSWIVLVVLFVIVGLDVTLHPSPRRLLPRCYLPVIPVPLATSLIASKTAKPILDFVPWFYRADGSCEISRVVRGCILARFFCPATGTVPVQTVSTPQDFKRRKEGIWNVFERSFGKVVRTKAGPARVRVERNRSSLAGTQKKRRGAEKRGRDDDR